MRLHMLYAMLRRLALITSQSHTKKVASRLFSANLSSRLNTVSVLLCSPCGIRLSYPTTWVNLLNALIQQSVNYSFQPINQVPVCSMKLQKARCQMTIILSFTLYSCFTFLVSRDGECWRPFRDVLTSL